MCLPSMRYADTNVALSTVLSFNTSVVELLAVIESTQAVVSAHGTSLVGYKL